MKLGVQPNMRLVLVGLVAVTLTACDLKTAFTGNVEVVARAGELELPSDTLAAILAEGKWPVQGTLAEMFAHHWVEFALVGQRFAQGDSLLDSASVYHAMWPDATQWLVDYYHDSVVAGRLVMDSATVDSAYQAGEHRIIYHIMIKTRPDMSPPERQDALLRADGLLSRLSAGMPWEQANEQNEDPVAQRDGGSIGILERGTAAPEFEEVAYRLRPDEVSDLVETRFGFHIIWRPALAGLWDEYEAAVEETLLLRLEDVFLAELEERWNVRVRSNAPKWMRESASAPLQTFKSKKVLGNYRDGEFTTADFVRWLQVLPEPVHMSVSTAPDEQLMELARTLVRNEVLILEAKEAGTTYREGDFAGLQERVRWELDKVREGMQFDSAFADAASGEERLLAVNDAILDFYHRMATDRGRSVVVPAFVADKLRHEMDWEVSAVGLDQVMERAELLRAELVARGAWPPELPPVSVGVPTEPDSSRSDANE